MSIRASAVIVVRSSAGFALLAAIASGQELLRHVDPRHPGSVRSGHFGSSVALTRDLDGDGIADLVVGSPERGATQRGRVDAFSGATGHALWSRDGEDDADYFGRAVAGIEDVDGDGTPDVLAAAPWHDESKTRHDTGRVYVLSGVDGAVVLSFDGEPHDQLGTSVSDVGDVDGDGRSDFAFGAPGFDGVLPDVGRAYVHSGAGGARLFFVEGTDFDQQLGLVVGRAGDHDGDRLDDLLIGSMGRGGPGVARGRAEVVSSATRATLLAVDGVPPHDFQLGWPCVSGSDLDHDGVPELVVGDPRNESRGLATGLVRVVSGATGATLFEWTGDEPRAAFGGSVAFVGDANGDGTDDVLVGVNPLHQPGSAILFSGATGRSLYRFASADRFEDWLGAAVAGGADLDADGFPELVVGAPRDDSMAGEAGRVWIYRGNDLFLQAKPIDPAPGASLALLTRAREGGVLSLLAVTAIDGLPLFLSLDVGPVDDAGRRRLEGDVPPGLAGIVVEFRAFALDARARIVDSAPASVTFR